MREPIKDLIDEYANIADKNRYKNDKQVINDFKDGSVQWNFNNVTKEYDYGGHAAENHGKKSTIPKKIVGKEDKKGNKTESVETPEKADKKQPEDKEETTADAKPEKKDKEEKKAKDVEEKPAVEKKKSKDKEEEKSTEEAAPKKEPKKVKLQDDKVQV